MPKLSITALNAYQTAKGSTTIYKIASVSMVRTPEAVDTSKVELTTQTYELGNSLVEDNYLEYNDPRDEQNYQGNSYTNTDYG